MTLSSVDLVSRYVEGPLEPITSGALGIKGFLDVHHESTRIAAGDWWSHDDPPPVGFLEGLAGAAQETAFRTPNFVVGQIVDIFGTRTLKKVQS